MDGSSVRTLAGHNARYSLTISNRKSGFSFSRYSTPRGRPCRAEKCVSTASFSRLVTSSGERSFLTASRARRYSSSCGQNHYQLYQSSIIEGETQDGWLEEVKFRHYFLYIITSHKGPYAWFSNRLLNLCEKFQLLFCVFKLALYQLATNYPWET